MGLDKILVCRKTEQIKWDEIKNWLVGNEVTEWDWIKYWCVGTEVIKWDGITNW